MVDVCRSAGSLWSFAASTLIENTPVTSVLCSKHKHRLSRETHTQSKFRYKEKGQNSTILSHSLPVTSWSYNSGGCSFFDIPC